MKYEAYGVEDFITDDFFVEWVKNPNSKSNEFWTKWMASYPSQVPTILKAQQFIYSIDYSDFEPLREEEYIEMFENVLKKNHKTNYYSPNKNIWNSQIKVAASIAILLLSSIAYVWHANLPDKVIAKKTIAYKKNNPVGQKSLMTLIDGSTVRLNSGSSLVYNSDFGINNRMVELKGEAFFDITKNSSLPFIITSGKLLTKVIGTSFNVRSYESEGKTQILVVRGEVSVSDERGSSFILNPKDLLEYTHSDKNVKKTICADIKSIIGWKDGILRFSNESFNEVAIKIQHWYGVEIVVEEGFDVRGQYKGEYQNMSLEKVMDGISFASGFGYEILSENKIYIYRKP